MSDNPEVQRALTMLTEATTILRRQSAGAGTSSSTTPDRVSELRNLFQPYNAGRIRPGPSSAGRGQRRQIAPVARFWSNRFFCLHDSQATLTPAIPMKMQLQRNGLGLELVQMEMNGGSDTVRAAIALTFPKLQDRSFELLRALSGGDNKPLVRISTTHDIPPVAYLQSIVRRGTVYIRPSETIMITTQNNESQNMDGNPLPLDYSGSRVLCLEMDEGSPLTAHPTAGASRSTVAISDAQTGTLIDDSELAAVRSGSTTLDLGINDVNINDFSTLDDFRADKIRENAGVQVINIRREEFATEVIGLYLKGCINLYKEPNIFFVGEPGRDFGALRREFFHEGMKAIIYGKYDSRIPIFDGEIDHKLPSVNASLLRGGVFEAVGKFLVHSIIHTGIACIGLSESVVEYLTCAIVSTNTAFSVTKKDVTQHEVREALITIESWGTCGPDPDALRNLKDVAWESGYEDEITAENKVMVAQHILYHYVVEKRKPQMEALKTSFVESGLTKFLSDRPYLVSGAFLRQNELSIPVELIIQKIELRGNENTHLLELLKEYLLEINPNGERSKQILSAWTGWPLLPDGPLFLKVENEEDFIVHACTNEMVVPGTWQANDLKLNLDLLFDYGCIGFGVV